MDDKAIQALEAEARARYAESLPKKPKGPKTETQKDEAAALRELERLKQQIELAGTLDETRKKATETARIQAAIDEGNFKNASRAIQQQLLDEAKKLDAANAQVESNRKLLEVRDQIANLEGAAPMRSRPRACASSRLRAGRWSRQVTRPA